MRAIIRTIVLLCAVLVAGMTAARGQSTLNVGLVPAEDPRLVISDNKLLMDHLARSLQMEVKPFVATDYTGVVEALRSKKLDIALLGPFSYVLATTIVDIEPFAIPDTEKQGATYRSVIIARKDRGWRSLADLTGKTFAFVDPSSTSGHLFPKAAMIRAGYNPDSFFARVIFSGGHDASAIAVQNGKVDAAAIADVLLEMAIKRGMVKREELSVLWTSTAIPAAPFVMRRDLPTALKNRIREAFAQVRDMPWGPANTIRRWEPTADSAYDVVRDTARLLNLDLKKLK